RQTLGDYRVDNINRITGRVEPTVEIHDLTVLHREVAARARDGKGELQERIDGIRLGRDDRVVEDQFAARVHVERVAFMRRILGETQTSVDQREAASGVDVDRTVDGVDDSRAHLSGRDRPVPGDDATDLVAGSGPRGRT